MLGREGVMSPDGNLTCVCKILPVCTAMETCYIQNDCVVVL